MDLTTDSFASPGGMRRNAVILAAGTASRFVPLSAETPKGLLEVKGEILIERMIRQLLEAGVDDITIVVGYMADKFRYLEEKYGVSLVMNEDYDRFNNTSSLIRVLDRLGNTYILTSDNYFVTNPFTEIPAGSWYSAIYAEGETPEYCMSADEKGIITGVTVGGRDSWFMYGPVFFSRDFSERFARLLRASYDDPDVRKGYWEDLYIRHIAEFPMKIRKADPEDILEFDSLDELRSFDGSYIGDTRSAIIRDIARHLGCSEAELRNFRNMRPDKGLVFKFEYNNHDYLYADGSLTES